jgi:hypothetical protein
MSLKITRSWIHALFMVGCAEGSELGAENAETGPDLPFDSLPAQREDGPPDPGDGPPDPASRITWLADVDGDWMIHATVSDAIASRYPTADHYELRLSTAPNSVIAALVDQDGELLELLRSANGVSSQLPDATQVVQFCFPFPQLPPVPDAGQAAPAPWGEWPMPGGETPDCIEIGRHESSHTVSLRAQVAGEAFALDVVDLDQDPEVIELSNLDLDPSQRQRITDAAAVLGDVDLVLGELEPMQVGCFKCWILTDLTAVLGAGCLKGDPTACVGMIFGADAAQDACEECE